MKDSCAADEYRQWAPDYLTFVPEAKLVSLAEDNTATRVELNGELIDIPLPIVNIAGNPKPGHFVSLVRDRKGLRIAMAIRAEDSE